MLALLTALLQISVAVLGYLRERKLLEAGKAAQIKENLDGSLELLGKLNKARADAVAKHDASGGLPDDKDPYRRN